MAGLINLGLGLSAAGGAIAQTAGHMALEEQKSQLDNNRLRLADSLLGAREHVARVETGQIAEGTSKKLSLIPQQVSIDTYLKSAGYANGLKDFGYDAPDEGGGSAAAAIPSSAGASSPTAAAAARPTFSDITLSPEGEINQPSASQPGSQQTPSNAPVITPIGGKGKVLGIPLPPGWTPQMAKLAGPDAITKAWAEFSKPGNLRPGSSLTYFDFATGKVRELYQQPNTPMGQLYDPESRSFVEIGNADAAIRKPKAIEAEIERQTHSANLAADDEHTMVPSYDATTGTTTQITRAEALRRSKGGADIVSPPAGSGPTQGAASPADGAFKMRDGSVIPPPPKVTNRVGGLQAEPSAAQKATQAIYSETIKGWNDAILPAAQAEQRFLAMAEALKSFQSGAWATAKVAIGRQLVASGLMTRAGVEELTAADPAKAQIIIKNNFGAALSVLGSSKLGRITQNEIFALQENLSNPKLEPEANLEISAQGVGIARFQQALANGWNTALNMGYNDPLTYQQEFMAANPLQKYIDQAKKEIGPLKGMPGNKGGGVDFGPAPPGIDPEDWKHSTAEQRALWK